MIEHRAAIGIGSNLGDREARLESALFSLDAGPTWLIERSSFHETAPVGGPPQRDFLNAAAIVSTGLSPRGLLKRLLEIEREHGRERRERFGPRTLDLDLLLYDDLVIDEEGLTVPHPRMHERRFVLEPLCEIAADWVHPKLGSTLLELLASLPKE